MGRYGSMGLGVKQHVSLVVLSLSTMIVDGDLDAGAIESSARIRHGCCCFLKKRVCRGGSRGSCCDNFVCTVFVCRFFCS